MTILVINAGSSSIKYKVYNLDLRPLLSGLIERIGEKNGVWHTISHEKMTNNHHFLSHEEAFVDLAAFLKANLQSDPIVGVGHRVVHGGKYHFDPAIITPNLLETIQQLSHLAPIHNPVNAAGIIFAQQCFPDALQVAVFDTGFHHTLPEYAYRYAINKELADNFNIRRYGFHGINHQYVAEQAATYLNKPLSSCNLITLHLGNGASACLIKQGKSYDTSMGMTPLAGLIMGTRCGDIDPSIALYLESQGLDAAHVDKLFNKNSGLMGIAKDNDMRALCARAETGDELAILAIHMFVYAIQKMIGAYFSQTPDLDAIVFTGGIGENASSIREQIIKPLSHLGLSLNNKKITHACEKISNGTIPILVIQGDEERFIAKQVLSFISNSRPIKKI